MPSGSRLPSLTITLRSEPSGFAENTWPLLALRKNKRAVAAFAVVLPILDSGDLTAMTFFAPLLLQFLANRLKKKPQFASIPLGEGAEPGYGFADDQVLHLERTFIGIKRFRICEEAAHVIVGGDTVPAAQLSRPCDRLATLRRGKRLCNGRMSVRQLAFGLQLRHAD